MNQTEMIPYIKIAFEICHSWSRTSDLKDRSTETSLTEMQREKNNEEKQNKKTRTEYPRTMEQFQDLTYA